MEDASRQLRTCYSKTPQPSTFRKLPMFALHQLAVGALSTRERERERDRQTDMCDGTPPAPLFKTSLSRQTCLFICSVRTFPLSLSPLSLPPSVSLFLSLSRSLPVFPPVSLSLSLSLFFSLSLCLSLSLSLSLSLALHHEQIPCLPKP